MYSCKTILEVTLEYLFIFLYHALMFWTWFIWEKPMGKFLKSKACKSGRFWEEMKEILTISSIFQLSFCGIYLLHWFFSWSESASTWFCAVRLQWPDTGLWVVWLTFMGCFGLCPKWMCFLQNYSKIICRSEFFISTYKFGNSSMSLKEFGHAKH